MKLPVLRLALLSLWIVVGCAVSPAGADTLGYPTTDHASFLVDIPKGWDVTPGEEEGDYVHVDSPSGITLAFRTIPGSETAMEEAIEDSVAYVEENFKGASLGEPVDAKQAGLTGFYMDGDGKSAEGETLVFRMAWLALKDGTIGEIWFVGPADDKAGIAAAGKALNSFRAP